MKTTRLFLIAACFAAATSQAPAQGFWQKAKEKAQNAAGQLGKTVTDNVKGIVTNSAELMVGRPDLQKDNDDKNKKGNLPKQPANGNSGNGKSPAGHGTGAGAWENPPGIVIDFPDFVWDDVSNVYDGVFTVKVAGRSNNTYRFYRIKGGEQISHEWSAFYEPRFDDGVCAVKSLTPYGGNPNQSWTWKYRWYILTKQGDSIALDPEITVVGNFQDGIAVADNGKTKWFINKKGQKVYPHIEPNKWITYPLVDGTRRMFSTREGFGYMDAEGRVVIQPQYGQADNFSGDIAFVSDYKVTGGKWWTINPAGNKVGEMPAHYRFGQVSRFINSGAVAHNFETDKMDIIDPQFRVKATYDNATPFYLATVPAGAAVSIVKNNGWKHPRFCMTDGSLTASDKEGGDTDAGQPFYQYKREGSGETMFAEAATSDYLDQPDADNFWKPYWGNTGHTVTYSPLIGGQDAILNYQGTVHRFKTQYLKPEAFAPSGYAKALKYSTKSWQQHGLIDSWYEELEAHMVFIDEQGKAQVEIIVQEEPRNQ